MQTPTEGAIYEDEHTGTLFECVHSPDTFGMTTMEAEHAPIEFETVDDGEWYSIYVDNFQRGYRKVADSKAELTA